MHDLDDDSEDEDDGSSSISEADEVAVGDLSEEQDSLEQKNAEKARKKAEKARKKAEKARQKAKKRQKKDEKRMEVFTDPSRRKAYQMTMQLANRVKQDNDFVKHMNDRELLPFVSTEPHGGRYAVIPVGEDEEILEGEEVMLKELRPGIYLDPDSNEVYQPAEYIDPITEKVAKTVRRHKRGAPTGATFKVSRFSAKEIEKLQTEDEEDDA